MFLMEKGWRFLMLSLWLSVLPGVVFATVDPVEMVRETADKVLNEVSVHKEDLDKDPSGIYSLVGDYVLPHFDFARMTRSSMGRFWRRASDTEKEQLIAQFRELLIRTYAVALLNYSGQKIKYLPLKETSRPDRVMVQTKVSDGDGGPEIPINYRLYHKNDTWKVYDVVIDGISLVSTYRSSFASKVRRAGINGLIEQLALQNEKK